MEFISKKTSELKKGDVILYYEAEFEILEDARLVRDYPSNSIDTSVKLDREFHVYGCACKIIEEVNTALADLLNDYDWIQSSDFVNWIVKNNDVN